MFLSGWLFHFLLLYSANLCLLSFVCWFGRDNVKLCAVLLSSNFVVLLRYDLIMLISLCFSWLRRLHHWFFFSWSGTLSPYLGRLVSLGFSRWRFPLLLVLDWRLLPLLLVVLFVLVLLRFICFVLLFRSFYDWLCRLLLSWRLDCCRSVRLRLRLFFFWLFICSERGAASIRSQCGLWLFTILSLHDFSVGSFLGCRDLWKPIFDVFLCGFEVLNAGSEFEVFSL